MACRAAASINISRSRNISRRDATPCACSSACQGGVGDLDRVCADSAPIASVRGGVGGGGGVGSGVSSRAAGGDAAKDRSPTMACRAAASISISRRSDATSCACSSACQCGVGNRYCVCADSSPIASVRGGGGGGGEGGGRFGVTRRAAGGDTAKDRSAAVACRAAASINISRSRRTE